jgi:large repetitive protein
MRLVVFISIVLGVYCNVFGQASITPYTYDPSRDPGFTTTQYESWLYKRVYNGSLQKLPFRLLKPVNYSAPANASKQYPLIIMLHGRGEAGTDNNYNLKWGGQKHQNAVNNAANPSFTGTNKFEGFVMFPQEPYGQWTNNYLFGPTQSTSALQQVWDVIDSLKIKYRIDPDRIAIHGLSSGGTGTWASLYHRPDLFATALPMSTPGDVTQMGKVAPIPIWLFQGGVDTNPIPYISQQVIKALRDSGAVNTDLTRYTEYPGVGHFTWDLAYDDPDFFPYILRQNKRKLAIQGRVPFCPQEYTALAISEGYSGYQWFRDGVIIVGENDNRLKYINTAGAYHVRYKRKPSATGYIYSDTVNITQEVTLTKPIVKANQSLILPSPSASNVTLSVPAGYDQYSWSTGATTAQITTSITGYYKVRIRQAGGCWSPYSDTVTVRVGSMGTPVPAMPTNLSSIPYSPILISFTWQDNATTETGYEIYRANKLAGPYTFMKLLAANTTAFLDSTVVPSTGYYYKVRAVNKVAATLSSTYAYAETFKDVTTPSLPLNLSLFSINKTGLKLKWNKSQDQYPIKRYIVYDGASVLGYATDTTYLFTELTPGESYAFYVEAEDYSGNKSGKSNFAPFSYSGQGLFATIYEGAFNNIPNISALKPVREGLVVTPTLPSDNNLINVLTGTKLPTVDDYFVLSFTGYIYVDKGGSWTLYTSSDDGSKLYINNTLVVNNDYLQGNTERSGTYNFPQAGWYPIRVDYFEKTGGNVLTVSYRGPAGNNPSKTTVPSANLATTSDGITPTTTINPVTTNFAGLVATNVVPVLDKIRVNLTMSFNGTPSPTIKSFELFRFESATNPTATTVWQKIADIPLTTTASTIIYNDTITTPGVYLKPNTKYYYALKINSDYISSSFYFF